MSWTKRKLIEKAYGEIGLASYVFDLQPDQLQDALDTLDAMMATWNIDGLRLGYPLSDNSDLDDDSGVPDTAYMAIYKNLAIEIAPGHGKAVSPKTERSADSAKKALRGQLNTPYSVKQRPGMPIGQGNKPRRYTGRFTRPPAQTIDAGADNEIELE